jgi:hypothetical protein
MRGRRLTCAAALLGVELLLASCGGDMAPLPTWTPAAPGSGAPVSGGLELNPRSARAQLGVAYPFQLYTHCGVDFSVDFDGSF